MRLTLEGSQAIAKTVALCRPHVVAAYPITPQTHIVENISKLVAEGQLNCELVSVESEFSAASVVLGASASGARAYTASSSQGILLMSEVLYNIAGLRLPLVMTCANRAVSAPLSIWNDHQDSMAVRDAGWIQLFCADNQEAVDTTIQAFYITEKTELPVMVCVDGFNLTHTLEAIDVPEQELVDRYLPALQFSRALNAARPISMGTLVSPDYFTEARHTHHQALENAKQVIIEADELWQQHSGRNCGGLLTVQGPDDARVGILSLGSTLGTLADAIEEYPDAGPAKLISLRAFRPFPHQALAAACKDLTDVVVLERALSPGGGGIVANELRAALYGTSNAPRIHSYAAGLGGRDIPLDIYPRIMNALKYEAPERFAIFDVELDKLAPADR
jgi:pyruvate ferredoxin oxidoreductase alpha subunit